MCPRLSWDALKVTAGRSPSEEQRPTRSRTRMLAKPAWTQAPALMVQYSFPSPCDQGRGERGVKQDQP